MILYVVLLVSFAAACASASPAWPVIPVPAACDAACATFPVIERACTRCLLGFNAGTPSSVPTWNRTSQPTLPRLPLYEAGLTSVPAVTLLFPSLWIQGQGSLTDAAASVCTLLTNKYDSALQFSADASLRLSGMPRNITVCQPSDPRNCTTRNYGFDVNVVTDGIPINGTVYKLLTRCCQCTPSAAELEAVSTILFSCVKTQGWLTSIIGAPSSPIFPCPLPSLLQRLSGVSHPAVPVVPFTTHFNTPDQLALSFTNDTKNGNKYAAFGEQAKAEAIQIFTSTTHAADSLWLVMHNAYAATLYLRKPKPSEAVRLQAQFGVDWQYAADLRSGTLYEMDMATWQHEFSYNSDPESVDLPDTNATRGWNVGAHVLFHRVQLSPTEITMRAIAVRLSGLYHSNASEVYTIAKSPTAFIMAMAAARTSYMTMLIWVAHVYHFHFMHSAVSYAMYHTVEPGVAFGEATHPVRQLLDTYLNPLYLSGFHAALFLGQIGVPLIGVPVKLTPNLYNIYANQGPLGVSPNTIWSSLPMNQLKLSNLDVAQFTSHGGKPWDLYPLASFHTNTYEMCLKYSKKVVALLWKCDAEIAADHSIQAFAKGLVDPHGANVRQFSATNKVHTRADMAELAAFVIFASVVHGTSHLQDYAIRLLSVAHLPLSQSLRDLPNALSNYTMQDLLLAAADMGAVVGQLSFSAGFVGAAPFVGTVPLNEDGHIDWTANLPFSKLTPAGQAANRAAVAFRKELSVWLDKKHDKYIKATNTNFGPPIVRLSPVIDI